MKEKEYFVYAHRSPLNKKVFYVGATTNVNLRAAYHMSVGTTETHRYLKKYNLVPQIEILGKSSTKKGAEELEQGFLNKYSKTIENKSRTSFYSKNTGRRPVADKVIQLTFYVKTSLIEAVGGMAAAREIAIEAVGKAARIKKAKQ